MMTKYENQTYQTFFINIEDIDRTRQQRLQELQRYSGTNSEKFSFLNMKKNTIEGSYEFLTKNIEMEENEKRYLYKILNSGNVITGEWLCALSY